MVWPMCSTTRGKYDEALGWYRRVLTGFEKSLDKGHPETLCAVYCMANVFWRQGKYDEAVEWCRRVLDGRENSLAMTTQIRSSLSVV